MKEANRKFTWWLIVAVAILMLTALFFGPSRKPITVTVVGKTNVAGTSFAVVAVSNRSRKDFAVSAYWPGRSNLAWKAISRPLELSPGSNTTVHLELAPRSRPEKVRFVCLTPEPPGLMQRFFMQTFALLRLNYPDPWRFETDLVLSE